jgi:hypothetical protein
MPVSYSREYIRGILMAQKNAFLDEMVEKNICSIENASANGRNSQEWPIDYYMRGDPEKRNKPALKMDEILEGLRARFPDCSIKYEHRPNSYRSYEHYVIVDWSGAKIQEEFIPLPTASAPLPVAAPPPAIGSKLRWTLDVNTYRVAIMTAKGLLQVKGVTDGASEFHPTTCRECTPCKELAMTPPAPWARRPLKQTMFADEAAWRASLPVGGSVEITPPAKPGAEQKVAAVAQAPNDVEKLKAAIKT